MDGVRPGDSEFDAAVFEARLEAVRAFAYGAGHEINNPLANIAARAQALLVDERDPERRRKLATIVDQAFRARDMIGGLMVFARPPRPNPMDVDVHDVLRPVVEAVRPVAESKRVRFEYSPPPAPVTVRADSAQVGEAVRALIANAIEAASEGGRVVVEASLAATACRVTVADDGHGMDGDAKPAGVRSVSLRPRCRPRHRARPAEGVTADRVEWRQVGGRVEARRGHASRGEPPNRQCGSGVIGGRQSRPILPELPPGWPSPSWHVRTSRPLRPSALVGAVEGSLSSGLFSSIG
jgi:hypothetical protein